jgi:hypothetical protein
VKIRAERISVNGKSPNAHVARFAAVASLTPWSGIIALGRLPAYF